MKRLLDLLTGGNFSEVSKRYSDIILAGGVVGIIGMMIIPLIRLNHAGVCRVACRRFL